MSAAIGRHTRATRSIYCPIAHLHRSRAVAEDVCAGRFTHAGATLELGAVPDWLADVHPDEEWRIEWWKLYEGLDLANAFGETGERRFLTAWERLVESFCAQVAVGTDTSDVAARRVTNILYARDAFSSADGFPGLRAGLEDALALRIASETRFVRANLTPARNHRTLELYALFLAALALPELDDDGELLRFALDALDRNLTDDFLADGVHCEASSHYHLIALRSFLAVWENARRADVELPADWEERLGRASEYALHLHRPDGGIPALSDADSEGHLDTLELAARLLGRDDLLYVATCGAAGTAPLRCNVDFPHGGYFFQRSGWGTERPFAAERFLVFDCGPLGAGGHGHYDLLSVEIAAGGASLVLDPGRGTYSEHGRVNLRRQLKSTAAHSTITVDGLDQSPYRRGKPRGPVAHGRWLGRRSSPGLDALCGEARSPCYTAVHRRRVLFVDNRYWLIEDVLSSEEAHRYDLRFQLSPAAQGRTSVTCDGLLAEVRAPGLALTIAGKATVRLEQGLVAPSYGVFLDAPIVSAVVDGHGDASFLTLVAPLGADEAPPELRLLELGPLTVVDVSGDRIGWSADPAHAGWFRSAA